MIKFENRFDEYAYRIASLPLHESVKTVEEGQWVTIKGGKLVLASSTDVKAFLAIGSKREGRDQVAGKIFEKISFLMGNFMLTVSNFDTAKTYSADMTALKVVNGNLAPIEDAATETTVAYAIGTPINGYLRIVSA